jgi:hypothetical protein
MEILEKNNVTQKRHPIIPGEVIIEENKGYMA